MIPAFSNAICSRVVAQIFCVVDVHAGDHRTVVIERIHRIQPATQPDLEYRDIHPVRDETLHRGQGSEFKVCEWSLTTSLFDFFKRSAQLVIARLLFVDADALVVMQQMRRGVATDAVSGGVQHGFQHRANRALAIGAADHNDGKIRLKIQLLLDLRHALQTKCDGFGVQGFEVG